MIRIRRLIRYLCVYTALGAVCTLAFAYLRCATFNWKPFRIMDAPKLTTVYGVGDLSPDGRAWSWVSRSGWGHTSCGSFIVDAAEWKGNQERPTPGRHVRGLPPPWSVAREHPFPPSIPLFQSQAWPHVADSAFGWPMRCVAWRVESLREVPMSADQAALMRQSPIGPELPAGALYEYPMDVRYGAHYPTVLSDPERNLHDGYWPTRVLWPGLLFNVLAWSLLLASPQVIRHTARALRQRGRRRRGCCIHCGYSRAGAPAAAACPECGTP